MSRAAMQARTPVLQERSVNIPHGKHSKSTRRRVNSPIESEAGDESLDDSSDDYPGVDNCSIYSQDEDADGDNTSSCLDSNNRARVQSQRRLQSSTHMPSTQGLSLFAVPNEYLQIHRWQNRSIYYYDEDPGVKEREREAFNDLAAEYCPHIKWESDRRRKDKLWSSFAVGIDTESPHRAKVACRYCGRIQAHPLASTRAKGNLNALKEHVRDCNASPARAKTMASFQEDGHWRASDYAYSTKKLQEAQLALAVCCNIPFTTFERPEFLDFLDLVRKSPSNKEVSNRKKLARSLAYNASQARQDLTEELKMLKSRVSVSLDAWTSPNHHSFLGIVIHFVDNHFRMRREILGFEMLAGVHTGLNMAERIWENLEQYGLLDKVGDSEARSESQEN